MLSEEANKGYPRQIFILTDGAVDNTDQVVAYVRKHANTTRVFTFGIGAEASKALCHNLAEAGMLRFLYHWKYAYCICLGSGACELVSDQGGQDLQLKVCGQLKKALQPAITNLGVDWGELKATQAPAVVPPLFSGKFVRQISTDSSSCSRR